jgi:ATP synthase protein I
MDENKKKPDNLARTVGGKEERRVRAREKGVQSAWFGLGTFGVVGWSVALPLVLLTLAGLWIDRRYPSRYSWTLTLLFLGLVVGCLNAWYWIGRQRQAIEREREHDRD